MHKWEDRNRSLINCDICICAHVYHRPMWPTGYVSRWRATGSSDTAPIGPAMTTLRSVIAHLAAMIRCAGIIYIVVQVVIWHSFYASGAWRLAGPALAVAWAVTVIAYLRRRWPSPSFACVDSAVYLALALGAQECVPPAVRDDEVRACRTRRTNQNGAVLSSRRGRTSPTTSLAAIPPSGKETGNARPRPLFTALTRYFPPAARVMTPILGS